MVLLEFRPGKLLARGARKIEQARGLLGSVTDPRDLQSAQEILQR